jgi:hypothetical protein
MVKSTASPLPLVREDSGAYVVCDEGRQFLERLSEDLPLAVIVVAGRYRTGKSFLLNRGILEASAKKGFATGTSVHACTRGVWLYPMPLSTYDNRWFLVLDTEGTASLEARADQDARLIGVALALASVFIFNSSGSLDETSLSDLATLASVAKGIAEGSDRWKAPSLVWVLRDFALQLQGPEGEDLSAEAYLEAALSEERYGKGGVRSAIKEFFHERTLFPMVRPCLDEATLQKLNNLGSSACRPEFQEQLDKFREVVKRAATTPKCIGGMALNGPALAKLTKECVSAVNEGRLPCIQTTFDFLQERKAQEHLQEALSELSSQSATVRATLPCRGGPRLSAPACPDFLAHSPELWAKLEKQLLKKRDEFQKELDDLNELSKRELMNSYVCRDRPRGGSFEEKLEELSRHLSPPDVLGLVPELYALHTELCRREGEEEALACRQSLSHSLELQENLEKLARESSELREEVDQALSQVAHVGPGMETQEAYAQRVAEMSRDAQSEMHALSESRDVLLEELRREEATSDGLRTAAKASESAWVSEMEALKEELSRAEGQRTIFECEAMRSSQEADHQRKAGLKELQEEFAEIVRDCESRVAVAREEKAKAERRCEDAEFLLSEGRRKVVEELGRLEELEAAGRREQEQARRKQTQELLERRQVMTEAYSGIVQDAQKAREAALSSDRKLMMAEVEKESLKRRLLCLENERVELAKTRKLYDDVRFKHASAEASLEAFVRLEELQKGQLQVLELELRQLRGASQQRDLELTRKVATLELRLQAHGIALQ